MMSSILSYIFHIVRTPGTRWILGKYKKSRRRSRGGAVLFAQRPRRHAEDGGLVGRLKGSAEPWRRKLGCAGLRTTCFGLSNNMLYVI